MCCYIQLVSILLRVFVSLFLSHIGHGFLVIILVLLLGGFQFHSVNYQADELSVCGKVSFHKIGINFEMFGVNYPWKNTSVLQLLGLTF
jgi:hypothetical protein